MTDTAARRLPRPGRRVAALLVRLLVLALIPVLIVTTPNVASAATKVSGTTRLEFGYDNWTWGTWASCSVQAFYYLDGDSSAAHQSVRWNSAQCSTGAGENLEGGTMTLAFKGTKPEGGTCEASAAVPIGADDDPSSGQANFGTSVLIPLRPQEMCTVAEMCWDLYKDSWMPGRAAVAEEGCIPANLGVPTMPTGSGGGTCPLGHPTSAVNVGSNEIKVTWDTSKASMPHSWLFSFRQSSDGGASYHWVAFAGQWARTVTVANGPMVTVSFTGLAGFIRQGVQLSAAGNPPPGVPPPAWNAHQSNGQSATQYATDQGGIAYGGITDPARCRFWLGQKFLDFPNTTADDPYLPMGGTLPPDDVPPADDPTPPPAPPAEDEGCSEGFTIWNPLTWGSAGFCEVVSALSSALKALGGIATAITKLPAKLLGLLSDLLERLFVPSEDYTFGLRAGDTEDALYDGGLGSWRDVLTSAPPYDGGSGALGVEGESSQRSMGTMSVVEPGGGGESNGCAGPSFTWGYFEQVGLSETVHPFSACEGTMATLASWTRLIAMVMMGVGCFVKCMEMLASSVGVLRQASIMSNHDWGNDHVVIKR